MNKNNMKSYYDILEVSETASEEDIKKSFRKQAMKLHPDRNPGNKDAEEKFKEMKNAYEILSDPYKRKQYDFSRHPNPTTDSDNSFKNNSSSTNNTNASASSPYIVSVNLVVEFWEAVFGCDKTFEFRIPNIGEKHKVSITLPEGSHDQETFLFETNGLQLQITIQVNEDNRFTRNHLDLFTNIEVPFTLASLGGTLIFPHWESDLEVIIPPGIKPNQRLLLPNKGIKREIFNGDLYLICNISIPKKLTAKQKLILEEFRKTELEQPNNIFESIKNNWSNFFKPKN